MAMTGQDWLNYFQKPQERKAGWLDTLTGLLGGGVGLAVGGPAGAMAGYGLGKSVGDVGENAVNHTLTPGNVAADAMGAIPQVGALGGAMQEAQARDLIRQLTAKGFPMGFAGGGVVPPPEFLKALLQSQQAQAQPTEDDPFANLTAQDIAGPAPTPQPLAQASHPGWEAMSAILGDVLSKLPPPRRTNSSNKTIGAYAPALGAAVSGPGAYAAGQRAVKNKPIIEANAAAEEQHKRDLSAAGLKLWERRMSLAEKRALAADKPGGNMVTLPDGSEVPASSSLGQRVLSTRNGLNPPEKAQQAGLTPQGVELAANMFGRTGQMPPMGMGAAGARAQIINRAAELYPPGSVAGNKAMFDANRTSLVNVQKMFDSVSAFEATALKNAQVLQDAMAKIADTGSPLLNAPLRSVSRRGLGSAELAAYDAAVAVVVPEFARILQSPTMAGQLTDEARKELGQIVNKNYTMKQMAAALDRLRQDAVNRRVSYQDQLNAIKERLGIQVDGKPFVPSAGRRVK